MILQQTASIPHKSTFKFEQFGNEVIFDSNFDSGNMSKVTKINHYQYSLWTASDCEGTDREGYPKSWFYYSVKGFQNTKITFNIHRLQVLWALLKSPEKYRPVYRINEGLWRRLESEIKNLSINSDGELVLSFQFLFASRNDKVQFAYTYPYTYQDSQDDILRLKSQYQGGLDIHFSHCRMIKSVEGRNIDMLMISSHEGKDGCQNIGDLYAFKQQKIPKFKPYKPVVMITARVHPLETPSSLCMNGIIDFLLNTTDARAYFLRKLFVFVLVPMLNPDGVAQGHCRMDTLNQNLNRYYKTPTVQQQPSCYAVRKLVEHYSKDKRLFFYLDLHAHPANKGNFVFGNAIFDFVLHVQSNLFPKLLSQNCINFQFQQCNFSRKHMKAKDRFEDMNKEGCGRVVVFKEFGVIHSYTLECGYHCNTNDNELAEHQDVSKLYKLKSKRNVNGEKIYEGQVVVEERDEEGEYVGLDYDQMDEAASQYYRSPSPLYNQSTFRNLGKNIVVSILDIWGKNPYPRVADPNELRKEIACEFRKLDRFKKQQSHLKTKEKNIVQLIQEQYYSTWMKRVLFHRQIRNPLIGTNQRSLTLKLSSLKRRDQEKDEPSKEPLIMTRQQPQKEVEPFIRQGLMKEVLIKQVMFSTTRMNDMGSTTRKQVNIRILSKKS